ncbi:hypothetical protein [Microbulbifer rhizosphaerae]|uniref:Uncharacterized protein n=1 Tax=Microbulbifer rhizosphaerae TaxID=1562603 RepID=A0A7W4WGA4_9GAMM|nr:hypothetical protein [Microbulbifer rhizosphaerae]MBB3063710.1 hypothetical protein [Microbulbifer rhizosphaerae]
MNVKESLRIIFRRAELAMAKEDSLGCPEMINFFLEIENVLRDRNDDIQLLEEAFVEDFGVNHECPWELAQLSMYHLRLPKFRTFLEKNLDLAIGRNDWRAIPVFNSILEAYRDPWDDKALFYENS